MRHWYGSYDMGFGTFILGQTWTPTFNPICNECLLGGGGFLDGFGDMGGSARRPGMQLHMPIKSRQRSSETCPSRARLEGNRHSSRCEHQRMGRPSRDHRSGCRSITLDKVNSILIRS